MMKNVIVVELKIDRKYDYYRIDKWIENTIIINKMKKNYSVLYCTAKVWKR